MKLVLENATKAFDSKIILQESNFQFEKGKIYGLLGKNGAGKTTLFNCIARNIALDSGEIYLYQNQEKQRGYDNTAISFVHTSPHLPAFMTAFEFVRFFLDINHHLITEPKSPAEYLLSVGIDSQDHHRLLKDFSHGMQNKVQMLVSFIVQPPVILLDEPLTSFDVVAAHDIKQMILKMKQDSIIIFSTHILQLAKDLCDEVVLLHNHSLQKITNQQIMDADFEQEVIQLLTEKEDIDAFTKADFSG